MKEIDLGKKIKKIHFIGIGGVSMSGLAELLHSKGFIISGSDRSVSKFTEHLKNIGIKIFNQHDKNNITDDIDLVVYTVAVKEDNEELIETKKRNILLFDRAELLGKVMKNYKYPISVSGIHGKTTTTSMISEIFLEADLNPSISVGTILKSIDGNFKIGGDDYFIVESCEYHDSFLKFHPNVGIILNVEEDHLDYFDSIQHIVNSFNQFAKNINKDGSLIINKNIKYLEQITDKINCSLITYGTDDSDFYISSIKYNNLGHGSFTINSNKKNICEINLKVPGFFNIENALASFVCCYYFKIPINSIKKGLENFTGSSRRFEYKGTYNNINVIDDYAHHPTEIKSTLNACKMIEKNNLWCIFQPHTFSRTIALFDDFVTSFDNTDKVIILDIFAAREVNNGEISSKNLVESIQKRGIDAIYIETFEKCVEYLFENCIPNDLLITMGAGDVYLVGEALLRKDLSTQSTDFK